MAIFRLILILSSHFLPWLYNHFWKVGLVISNLIVFNHHEKYTDYQNKYRKRKKYMFKLKLLTFGIVFVMKYYFGAISHWQAFLITLHYLIHFFLRLPDYIITIALYWKYKCHSLSECLSQSALLNVKV